RQTETTCLYPFLQHGLGIAWRRLMARHHLLPGAAHKSAGPVKSAVQKKRAQRRLQRIGQHGCAPPHAGLRLARRNRQRLAETDRLSDLGQDRLRYEHRQPPPQVALLLAGIALCEPFGDQQTEDAVTDEFHALVGALAAATA